LSNIHTKVYLPHAYKLCLSEYSSISLLPIELQYTGVLRDAGELKRMSSPTDTRQDRPLLGDMKQHFIMPLQLSPTLTVSLQLSHFCYTNKLPIYKIGHSKFYVLV